MTKLSMYFEILDIPKSSNKINLYQKIVIPLLFKILR